MATAVQQTFATEWDTAPNPVYDVWTSVNGSEIVPGIISPLIATTFNRFDHLGLRRLMATYPSGDDVKLVEPPAGNFFGIFGGRLALNNGFSVAAVSVLDADIAQAILQQFFTGATGGERFIVDASEATRAEAFATAQAQRAAAPAMLAGWQAALYAERSTGRAARDRELDLGDAWARWNELLDETNGSFLNLHYIVSVAAAETQVRLAGVIAAGGGDPNVVVGLCSGLGEVESSKPAIRLYELAQMVREDEPTRAAFESFDLDEVGARLLSNEGGDVGEAFRQFLFDYGYRGQGEADPTNADWSEQPTFVLSQIRAMLHVPDSSSPRAGIEHAVAAREGLEAAVREGLPEELRAVYDGALDAAQTYTRMRELSKATWVLGVRRARAPYLALCRGLVGAGAVDSEDDAKFLTFDEIGAIVAGGSGAVADSRERVARRRAQAAEAENYRLPDNWVGAPEFERVGEVDRGEKTLAGLGVSIGDGPVTGTARIIPSAEAGLARDLEPGEILVAPFTDAPWTPLFIVAGAVVVETGGVLSHAATVAREFGIPAVVMVHDATRIIADGDTVTVDGAAGTVTIAS
jgi:rifampicin phosphotransferase